MTTTDLNSQQTLNDLAACTQPFLIGVRHHSAAMAKIMPQLLDAFAPQRILLELPPEFTEWLPWLANEDTIAPIALAGCRSDGADLCFYPFADFSPELATIRWAFQHNIPIEPFDLPVAERDRSFVRKSREPRGLLQQLMHRTDATDVGQLWDRLVESPALGSTPEQTRRAGLLFGWALRWNDNGPSDYDRRREEFMRSRIAESSNTRCAAVIGAYHAVALLPEPKLWGPIDIAESPTIDKPRDDAGIATALIPYAFEQLDERSGYPAGVRDPMWHQSVFDADSIDDLDLRMVDLIVGVCRELRIARHPMNAADAQEVVRVSRDLARVRNFPAPGRQEVIEAMQLCLTQGQVFGTGRAVAAAMQTVLVGQRSGSVPDAMPRCGLAPHVEDILKRLRLPGPKTLGEEKRMRLDPLRSALDRSREVVFRQFAVCQIPYASADQDGSAGDRESLTSVWSVKWENTTAAMISLSSARGATLQQAAEGVLRAALAEDQSEWGAAELQTLLLAAQCGFSSIVNAGLNWINGSFSVIASLAELTAALSFVDRVLSRHIPGLPAGDEKYQPEFCQPFEPPEGLNSATLLQSAIARIEGLQGSEDDADVAALLDLLLWFQQQDEVSSIDSGRLLWSLRNLAQDGSPLMHGAATSALFLLQQITTEEFQERTGSWLDSATTAESRQDLQGRLRGALLVVQPRLFSETHCLDGLDTRIATLDDNDFMQRLPALRKGFHVLSVNARKTLLKQQLDRLPNGDRHLPSTDLDPEEQQLWFQADNIARLTISELMPDLPIITDLATPDDETLTVRHAGDVRREVSQRERWQLILGDRSENMTPAGRTAARALDELYGQGSGEGGRSDISGKGGGTEAPYPNVREWAEDLEELFGETVREEVLGEAVGQGRAAALTVMNDDNIRPSVELLEQVLSMKGSLPEAQTEKLRRIAKRITEQLSKELATRMAPALTGLSTPRPTRRRSRKLDLRRTIMANLHTARIGDDGRPRLAPEDFFFRTPAKRSMDWHIIYVVDVSGSMEPSVIYSALTAAVFSGLPALSVSFLAFSTEVVDFTGKVEDPLEMLMAVTVGGGTYISLGLQAARERMKVPSRTIVLLITDFEEGGSVGKLLNEVQAIVATGAKALGLAALSDDGKPRYHTGIASQVAGCGMPVAALSPGELARWVGEQIR